MGLFPTRHEWYQHELQAHRRRWQCVLCDNSDVSFLTEERMTSHFEQQHTEVMTHDQTEIVLNACERQMHLFDSSACALCTEWNPPSTQEANVKQFFQHLARHQQRIALEALPLYIEGLEIQVLKTPEASDESSADSKASPASSVRRASPAPPVGRPTSWRCVSYTFILFKQSLS